MKSTATYCWLVAAVTASAHCQASGALDWSDGPWGIVVGTNGPPASLSCTVDYPTGSKTGNAVAVHYQLNPTNIPQLWVFLTNGFWRQASAESQFLTSYRLFRYYSSGNQDCDTLSASGITILGTNSAGELLVRAVYDNNSLSGDRFHVVGLATLEKPDQRHAAMRADLVVSNASGRAVSPFAGDFHRLLSEQWEIFSVSSMYVADNLTAGLPSWYDGLDPGHLYLGITNDAGYLNDGHSLNGGTNVSTHDVKYIATSNLVIALNHDTNLCPVAIVPAYDWYRELVMYGQVASELLVQHAYRSSRNHRIQVTGCSGLAGTVTSLTWSATYNRGDANMVDGDNIQIKLGMDACTGTWPVDGVQTLNLRLTSGNTRPSITALSQATADSLTINWTTENGEAYNLQHAPALSGTWSNVAGNISGPSFGPLALPPGFFRIAETNTQ